MGTKKYSKEEEQAIYEKLESPSSEVVCPRCGKKLCYRECNCGCEVKCETHGCICVSVRGL